MGSFRAWRAYRKLPAEWREIVFYAESGQDWHHFEPLIAELTGKLRRKVCYVTSADDDPGLRFAHPCYHGLCIPEGWFLTIHFQFQQAAVVVLTMMDLDHLNLKRSIHPVHYAYVFHSLGSTHMADRADSYDAYDSLFCGGPHQVRELRRREQMQGMPARTLVEYGYPRLERLMEMARRFDTGQPASVPTVLVAPTWGEESLFHHCGRELLAVLLEAGFRVIMRPHYQTRRSAPEVLDRLLDEFEGHERFEVVEQMGETDSLFRSDVLISDWSGMAIEYALGLEKPVLSIDLPPRARNPDWRALGLEPFESAIRGRVGEILAPDRLAQAPDVIRGLLRPASDFAARMQALREEMVFNIGHAVPVGARQIARLADENRQNVHG